MAKGKNLFNELELVLIDQAEKLGDDTLMSGEEESKALLARSKGIAELADSFANLNRVKLDIAREISDAINGEDFKRALGLEAK